MKKRYQDYPDFLSTNQVAELLNISKSTVLKKIRHGVIPVHYTGRPYRIKKDDLYGNPEKPADIRAKQNSKKNNKKK